MAALERGETATAEDGAWLAVMAIDRRRREAERTGDDEATQAEKDGKSDSYEYLPAYMLEDGSLEREGRQ